MTRIVPSIPAFDPSNIIGWATALLHWYELFFNRIKNLQANYCDKAVAKFAAFYPDQLDQSVRWNLFVQSPWWLRFHRLSEQLQFDYDSFVKTCIELQFPMPAFHCLRSGSIIPAYRDGLMTYQIVEHSFQRALSPPMFQKLLADFFHI